MLEDGIDREDSSESSPLGGHVGDGESFVDREGGDSVSSELDDRVENLVLVEGSAEGDDNVLSGYSWRKMVEEGDLDDRRDLPPGSSCGPDGSGVGLKRKKER